MNQFDVIIIGGGVVGLSAALGMALQHYSVAVIDSGALNVDTTIYDLRVYAINKASQDLLGQLEVWPLLADQRISPYKHMHVWDASNGAHIDFDSRSVAAPFLGHIIEESILKEALLQQVKNNKSIQLFPCCSADEIKCTDSTVTVFSTDQTWTSKLLIIADGANSPTRKKLNINDTHWSYHQHALVATVGVEKSHEQTAYQVFNSNGPLAFLPLKDSHQCSIVWSTDPEYAEDLKTLDEDRFNTELTKAFAKELGQVKLMSTRHTFPLQMRHVNQYAGDRWLLMGDAAHTIHPLAGLGLNVGLADVSAWLKLLSTKQGCLTAKKLLGSYQRERKHAVWQTIVLMEGFKRLFSNSSLPVSAIRGLGLRLCNESNLIKRYFIEHAGG